MSITTTKLTRAAGLSAVVGGLLFIAVQIKHPLLDATFTTTTEYAVRETMNVGAVQILVQSGFAYIVGGLIFGIALFRANVLARWAAMLLSVGAVAILTTSQLPELTQRLFAIPVSVALIGLGFSLWREQRTQNTRPMASPVSSQLDPTGAK